MTRVLLHSSSAAKLHLDYSITQTIETNKSKIALSMYVTPTSGWNIGPWTDGGSYLGDSTSDTFKASISNISSETLLRSTSFEVEHDDDGTKEVTIYWKWGVNSSWGSFVRPSGTVKVTLPTIPRVATISSFTCSTEYLNGSVTVGYDCKSTSLTHKVRFYTKDTTIDTFTVNPTANGAQTYSHTFNSTQLATIYALYPNDVDITIGVKIETYNGSTLIGESASLSKSLTIPTSVIPTVSTINVSDAAGLVGTFGAYIQSKSSAKVTIEAAGAHGSTIKSYTTTVEGVKYSGSSFTSHVLKTSDSLTVSTTVTDSRGRTSTAKTTSIIVYPYYEPKITKFEVHRSNSDGTDNNDGEYARFTYSYDIAPVNSKNTKSAELQYYSNSQSKWITITTKADAYAASNATYIESGFSVNSAYRVRIMVSDYFTSSTTERDIPTAFTLINFKADGTAIGFGKVSETSDIFDFGSPVRLEGGINAISIPENADLNSYTTTGFYRCLVSETAQTLNNCPVTSAFHMYVGQHTANGWCQFLVQHHPSGQKIYTRNIYNGTFGDWERIPLMDEVIPTSGGKITGNLEVSGLTNGYLGALYFADLNTVVNMPAGTIYMRPIYTDASSGDLPSRPSTGEWYYSGGFVVARSGLKWVILFSYSTLDIAINRYVDGVWSGWEYITDDVGDVVITSTNTPPKKPGTWELIDKEFAPIYIAGNNFTINTSNTTDAYLEVTLGGHNISLKLGTTNKTAITDSEAARGTIQLSAIGVTALPYEKRMIPGTSDGGNAWSLWIIATNGAVKTVDCHPYGDSVAADNYNYVYADYTIRDPSYMLDSFCNKFYWKRTA